MVVGGGLFEEAKPALTSEIRGRVDESEDPRDVYRLIVPAGATASISLRPRGDLGLNLWSPETTTVTVNGANTRQYRLGTSNRKGKAVERITWKNRSGSARVVFVDVWIPAREGVQRPGYGLAASVN